GVVLFGAIGAILIGVLSLVAAAVVMRRAGIVRTALTMTLTCVGCGLGIVGGLGQLRVCCAGAEATAIGSLRSVSSAESTYAASCAGGGYAVDLVDLATPPT